MHIRIEDENAKYKLEKLQEYLSVNGLGFYVLSERYEGKQKYVDITISVKLA